MALTNVINSALMWPMAIKVLKTLREEAGILSGLQRDFDPAPAQVNETVTVGMAPALAAGTVTPAPYLAAFPSDMTLKYAQISLANWDKAEFALSSRDCAKLRIGEWVPQQMVQAVRAVLNSMRAKCLTALLGVNGHVHSAQTTGFFNSTDGINGLIDARATLARQLAPAGGRRMLVVDPLEEANALKLDQFLKAYAAGDANAFRNGSTGRVLGFEFIVDNSNSFPSSHVNGADDGAYVMNGAHAQGTTDLVLITGANTILAGDIVTVTDATTGTAYSYAVKTGIAAPGTLVINEPGLMMANATGSTVVVEGTASATVKIAGYAFDPNAIMLVSRTPSTPDVQLGTSQIVTDPLTGLSLKLSLIPGDEAQIWRVSCLYGVGLVDPRLGVRLTYST
jgi:hypothetical protein